MESAAYLEWTEAWVDAALPKLRAGGSLYVFLTWR
jgi:site-specific DNA-methyltransferase (adenine-specific)